MQNRMPADAERALSGRVIASLGTANEDSSVHLTAVWYLFENGLLYVATSARSRKARNVAARARATLMVDVRKAGSERGLVAICFAEIVTGKASQEINARIHRRYMSESALADPRAGGTMAALDDTTLKLTPEYWYTWDMSVLDKAVFAGAMSTPGYLLPLD